MYKPSYVNSWALVVGINDYPAVGPLLYARNDAEGVAEVLENQFNFPRSNITLLLDERATRTAILKSFLRYTADDVGEDDRVIVFFAGHGFTKTGRRGEVGYLVPHDGDLTDIATLLRWDDLTKNSELIRAKHLFFVMDACYGGLAMSRSATPPGKRFLDDMLQRHVRQLLTAGKADEPVSDSGGPKAGHSIFTGHLLEALEGAAQTPSGIICATSVMAYVYKAVAQDPASRQSPHFGFLEGDGDFIFRGTGLTASAADSTPIEVPAVASAADESDRRRELAGALKEYFSDARHRIALDELVSTELRGCIENLSQTRLDMHAQTTSDEVQQRVRSYEDAVDRLLTVVVLLARWGTRDHQPQLRRIVERLSEQNTPAGGKTSWLGLRWYPLTFLMYGGGIAALSAENYISLTTLIATPVSDSRGRGESSEVIVPAVEGMLEVKQTELFKRLPGHEKDYVPVSEHLYERLGPRLQELLFIGSSYDALFDLFEVIQALVYADVSTRDSEYFWGPPGRFGWKQFRGNQPFQAIVASALQQGPNWPPLAAGFFGSSAARFAEVASRYESEVIRRLRWG